MPTPDAIDAALRDPNRFAPGVRRLGGGSLAVTAEGGLWRVVGGAAAVYALKRPTGRILALRVPLDDRAATDLRAAERWRALASDPALGPLRGEAGALPAELRYMPDALTLEGPGFRSSGHPLVAMEFLPGGSVALAAQQAAAAGDRPRLARLARTTTRLFLDLERVRFDHGRLRPASILLRGDGSPVLVGLETALWPGTPRPGRNATHDRLPALALLTELLALADDPGRIAGTRSAADRLLLSERDLRDPAASAALAEWRAAGDPLLATAAALLGEALLRGAAPAFSDAVAAIEAAGRDGGANEAPRRDEPATPARGRPPSAAPTLSIGGNRSASPSATAWEPPSSPAPAVDRPATPARWTEERLLPPPPASAARQPEPDRERRLAAARQAAAVGDVATLLRLWDDGDLATYEPAADLHPSIERARAGGTALADLRKALAAGDAQRVAAVWPAARKAPGAALVAARVDALLTGAVSARARQAARRRDAAAMVDAVRFSQELGVALDPETRRAARRAAMAGERRDRLARAIAAGEAAAIVEAAAMTAADEATESDPATARAVARARASVALERAVQSDDDLKILAAVAAGPLAEGGAPHPEMGARVDLARARAAWLANARAAIRARDGVALRGLLAAPPDGALAQLRPTERRRIDRLARSDDAARRLETALREGPDAAVLDALAEMAAAGLPLPDALDWAAVRGVADRVDLYRALRQAATANPPDYRALSRLLPAARAAMGAGLSGADDLDFARLEREVLRAAAVARLREALAGGDAAAIRAAADPDPLGALGLLTPEERAQVAAALRV